MKKSILQFLILCFSVLMPILTFGQAATINFNTQYQKIDGFGGSSAWQGQLSNAELQTLFQNGTNQLGFNILRLRIDPTMAWAQEAANAKNAKALGATVFATPWSPPASMKTNNNVVGGQLLTTSYAAYASYLNQFINYVGTNNIDIISLQNEPDYNPTYESCSWDAAQFHTFCLNNAGSIIKPVMMPESFNYSFALSDPTLNDPAAAKNISYIGGHLYGSNPQTYTNAINLGKPVWMTEWNATDYSATGLMVLGKQVLDCMYQNFNAYVYWWVAEAGNGVISSAGVPNGYGYIMAQFSKYVRPGYYRVDATYNPQSGVYVVAFKGNGNYVVVTVNNSTSSKTQQFTLENGTVANMTKYTTSISKNISDDGTVAVTGGSFTSTLDAQSVTTFVGVSSTTCTAPAAPTVTSPITYCQGSTTTALKATAGTGGTLNWYTTSSGGTSSAAAPTPSATTAGSTTYYVSQTIGCEGPRASIVVSVNALPTAPTVTSPVSYCQNTNASGLTATGTSLKWYTAASGGTGSTTAPTPSTTTSGTTSYYVSQTVNTCESPRASIAVTVNALPVITPYVQLNGNWLQQNTALSCAGTTIALGPQPVVTNGWTWTGPNNYTSTARQITLTNLTIAQGGVYTANYTDANGCQASSNLTLTVNALPTPPTITSPVTYCQGTTASALTATVGTGGTLNWYGTNAAGGTAGTTAPMPSTTTTGTTSYYVSQTINTCEGPRATIAVTVNSIPSAPTVSSPVAYCQGTTASALTATTSIGGALNWYTSATGGIESTTAPTPTPSTTTTGTTSYYVSQTVSACESPRSAIAVTINAAPTASNAGTNQYITTNSATLSANAPTTGTGTWTVVSGTGTFSNSALSNTSVSGLSIGANVLEWTISNSVCPPSSSTVTINVGATPTIQTITGPANVAKDSSATYAITTPTGVTNHWSVPAGATITSSNSDSSQVTISFGASGGAVGVTQTNSFGSTVDTESISVGASPVTPTITGPAYIATGSTGISYSAPDNSGSTYHWTIPVGAIITSATTDSNSITVSYGTSVITGTVSVTETNLYGSAGSSLPVSVGNAPTPQTITGDTTVTANQTGVNYSVPDNSGSTYHWTLPAGATITSSNADSSQITVSFGSTGGTVKVTETNPYGTASSSIPVSISTTTTAVISKTGGNFIEVKPNPFNDYATIMVHSETTEPIMLTVINVQGVICYSSSQYSTNQEFTIGSELQSDGLYFVRLAFANEVKVLKIVKVK